MTIILDTLFLACVAGGVGCIAMMVMAIKQDLDGDE